MNRIIWLAYAVLVFLNGFKCLGKGQPDNAKIDSFARTALQIVQVDIHERLYPDRWPQPTEAEFISVPRGAPVALQFAVRAKSEGTAHLTLSGALSGKARIHWLQAVHVEGNTQGSLKNRPGGEVPEGWMDHLVRAAPFDTLEVLVEGDRMPIVAGRTHGVVVELAVPRDAAAGMYKGRLQVSLGNDEAVVPFSYRVHETVLPDPLPLHSVHWLWPEPVNLTSGNVPEWWSEEHWKLLETAGRQLRRFGDDTVWTPLVNYREPLIQITRRKDGTYAFDYTRLTALARKHLPGVRTIDAINANRQDLFSPQGLRPSIRIVSFREGLIDYALLTALAKHDPVAVEALVAKIAPSITKFERNPVSYHHSRTAILEALDKHDGDSE